MRKLTIMMAAAAMMPFAAHASVYDSLGDFAESGYNQGFGACNFNTGCQGVDAYAASQSRPSRTGLDKAFDGDIATMHSLGVLGVATFGVLNSEDIIDVLTLEATTGGNGGATYPESVGLFFSNQSPLGNFDNWDEALVAALPNLDLDGTDNAGDMADLLAFMGGDSSSFAGVSGSALAALLNSELLGDGTLGALFSNNGPGGFDIAEASGINVTGADAGDGGWSFHIDLDPSVFGNYRYLTLVDLTMSDNPAFWGASGFDNCDPGNYTAETCGPTGDGWDLAELRVEAVPEPATLALFGAGLLGLGAVRRRRRAA